MTTKKTIGVTGGTGFVGKAVVKELLARGHAVRVLARDFARARAALGKPDNLTLVQGDVTDAGALGELLRGADACVHLVGIIREARGDTGSGAAQTFERMHIQATAAVLAACQGAGVKRYLHMSALGVGPQGRAEYQQTKWQAELLVRRSGLEWTIFRPSLIHGPDGEFVKMMSGLVSGNQPPYVFIPYFVRMTVDMSVPLGPVDFTPALVQPVSVLDVAEAFASALDTPAAVGEVYNLVGPERLNWQELSEFFRDTLPSGKKGMGTWFVPGLHASYIAQAAGMVGLGGLLPFDAGQALMATEDSAGDPTKAATDLGLTPRPFRQTVRAYADQVG